EYMNKKVEELSKKNQQKIQFISAVIHKPKLLILDEPFSGLYTVNVEMLKSAMTDLKEQANSIVFTSHCIDHLDELCDHLCIIQKVKPVVQGELREIKLSFGKKNLIIHGDVFLDFLEDYPGVLRFRKVMQGCQLQIENEAVSQQIFSELQGKGFIRKFELEEPSLNDIFIEKVGVSYE